MHGECIEREQNRISILIQLIKKAVYYFSSFPQPDDDSAPHIITASCVSVIEEVIQTRCCLLGGEIEIESGRVGGTKTSDYR